MNHLPNGPPVGRRPLPNTPQASAPNRMAGGTKTRERPKITVLDARPMDQVGFRGLPASGNQKSEESVKMRPPPPMRPPSSFRRSMPMNMDKVGLSGTDAGEVNINNIPSRSSMISDTNSCDTRPIPDIIAGQQIHNIPPRNVDLLSDVPASSDTGPVSPPHRGVPVLPMQIARPLPANRGPPPPLPKKSPSVPNLFNANGDSDWSVIKPISIDSDCDTPDGSSSRVHPSSSAPRKPTIIRPSRPSGVQHLNANEETNTLPGETTSSTVRVMSGKPTIIRPSRSHSEVQPASANDDSKLTTDAENNSGTNVKALSEKISGGVRVLPFALPKSITNAETKTSSGENSSVTETSVNSVKAASRKPTIIRPTRPQSEVQNDEADLASDSNGKASSEKISGGIRVFPFALPKSTSDSGTISESQNVDQELFKPKTKPPPAVKPKPMLLPKPALRPKPAVATKPKPRPQSAAFASSMKFAQMLETGNSDTSQITNSHSPRNRISTSYNQKSIEADNKTQESHFDVKHSSGVGMSSEPKKGPMKATYRPTIIRASIRSKDVKEEPKQESQPEFAPISKKFSSSCTNMSTGMTLQPVEFNDDAFIQPKSEQTQSFSTQQSSPQPAKRQPKRPTIIRPKSPLNVSSPSDDTQPATQTSNETEESSHRHKSVSFAEAEDVKPLNKYAEIARPQSTFHISSGGGILRSAMSMSDISSSKRNSAAPPSRPSAPPVRKPSGSRTPSASDASPLTSPSLSSTRRSSISSVTSEKSVTSVTSDTPSRSMTSPQPIEPASNKKKPPPRPTSGPTRRSSSSSSHRASPPGSRHTSHSSPLPSPGLPQRPGPGHPLFHYVAKGPHAVALYDYQAQQHDELSFQAGSVIELVQQKNAEWLIGRNASGEGLFPASFVNVIEPLPQHLQSSVPAPATDNTETQPPPLNDTGYGPRCLARFDYDATEDGDLPFKSGDVIILLEHVGDDWLKGEVHGQVGVFPLSFVEILEDVEYRTEPLSPEPNNEEADGPAQAPVKSTPASPAWDDEPKPQAIRIGTAIHDFEGQENELSFKAGAKIHLISRLNADWLFGELGRDKGSFPANFIDTVPLDLPAYEEQNDAPTDAPHSAPIENTVAESPVTNQHQNKKELYLVKFDFPGEHEGDLPLKVGDIVNVIENVDSDWMKGSLAGRQGTFPASFVVPFTETENTGTGPEKEASTESYSQSVIAPHPEMPISANTHTESPENYTVATALFDFAGDQEGDLTLTKGAQVIILETVSDEWLRGRVGDEEGIFPANFVEVEA